MIALAWLHNAPGRGVSYCLILHTRPRLYTRIQTNRKRTQRENGEREQRARARRGGEGSVCVKNQPDSAPPGGGREGETKRECE